MFTSINVTFGSSISLFVLIFCLFLKIKKLIDDQMITHLVIPLMFMEEAESFHLFYSLHTVAVSCFFTQMRVLH